MYIYLCVYIYVYVYIYIYIYIYKFNFFTHYISILYEIYRNLLIQFNTNYIHMAIAIKVEQRSYT